MTHEPDGAAAGAEANAPSGPDRPTELAAAPGSTSPAPEDDPGLSSVRAVPYRGEELDAERGPGLGCFRFQLVVLVFFVVLTPIGVTLGWPDWLTAGMLFTIIVLLFFTGQTMIFLMRLVAADRRGRRRPLAGATPTVGQLEDVAEADEAGETDEAAGAAMPDALDGGASPGLDGKPTMRQ